MMSWAKGMTGGGMGRVRSREVNVRVWLCIEGRSGSGKSDVFLRDRCALNNFLRTCRRQPRQ